MSDSCIFCKILSGAIPAPTVYEDEYCKIIHDKFPCSKGHLLIISKAHIRDIFAMPPQTAGKLFEAAAKASQALKRAYGIKGMNILQNNGAVAGQEIGHFHIHLLPRSEEDDITLYKPQNNFDDNELESACAKIKAKLEA